MPVFHYIVTIRLQVSNNSLVLTYNYAYGGATIDASLVTPYEPTVLSMTDQVNEFLAQPNIGTGSKVWTSDDSLFSFWIGAYSRISCSGMRRLES